MELLRVLSLCELVFPQPEPPVGSSFTSHHQLGKEQIAKMGIAWNASVPNFVNCSVPCCLASVPPATNEATNEATAPKPTKPTSLRSHQLKQLILNRQIPPGITLTQFTLINQFHALFRQMF